MAHHGIDADELRLIPIDWVVWVTAGDLGDHGLGLISLSTLAGAELSGPRSCCQPATCFACRQKRRRFLCHDTLLSRASNSCATARFTERNASTRGAAERHRHCYDGGVDFVGRGKTRRRAGWVCRWRSSSRRPHASILLLPAVSSFHFGLRPHCPHADRRHRLSRRGQTI